MKIHSEKTDLPRLLRYLQHTACTVALVRGRGISDVLLMRDEK